MTNKNYQKNTNDAIYAFQLLMSQVCAGKSCLLRAVCTEHPYDVY